MIIYTDVNDWNKPSFSPFFSRTSCGVHDRRSFFCFRKSRGVHDCRCPLRHLLEQLHFMSCCRSLGIFSTEVGRTVTVTIAIPTNPNMAPPQIGFITGTFCHCINVCLLLFVLGFSLTALSPEVKFASIVLLGKCSLLFLKVCTALPFPRFLIWAHSIRCCFAMLDRGTGGHVFVFIADDVSMCCSTTYRERV